METKEQTIYTSYAKDILIEYMRQHPKAAENNYLEMMKYAVALIKLAKENFKD